MIYVHIPFCRSFCTYCDFYSEAVPGCKGRGTLDQRLFLRYQKALCDEILSRRHEITGEINTLYIGGGTPSVLPLSFFEALLQTLKQAGVRTDFEEFTVEVNPEDVVEKGEGYIRGLTRLGVNRISMGVQSFDDGILKWMNRRHNSGNARRAYHIIESSGMENISIDLIFGLGRQTLKQWEDTVHQALEISSSGKLPPHISAYQLSVEPGSMLAEFVRRGTFREASQEECRQQYDLLCKCLNEAGYHHYEISNFALEGKEAIHNSAYWDHVTYTGFGPGAHSFLVSEDSGNQPVIMRKWNNPDLKAYLDRFGRTGEGGDSMNSSIPPDAVVGSEILTKEQYDLETLMLSLRTSAGVDEGFLRAHTDSRALEKMLSCGCLVPAMEGRIRIPEESFFISDGIIAEIA